VHPDNAVVRTVSASVAMAFTHSLLAFLPEQQADLHAHGVDLCANLAIRIAEFMRPVESISDLIIPA
jgi:hypothetical protein